MRRPCPLYLDLISLILESDIANQHWLHFPWFQHAGTRISKAARHEGGSGGRVKHKLGVTLARPSILIGAHDDLAGLRADAGANRPARAASNSPQMVLFPAEVARWVADEALKAARQWY
jgi:hypothetical protein